MMTGAQEITKYADVVWKETKSTSWVCGGWINLTVRQHLIPMWESNVVELTVLYHDHYHSKHIDDVSAPCQFKHLLFVLVKVAFSWDVIFFFFILSWTKMLASVVAPHPVQSRQKERQRHWQGTLSQGTLTTLVSWLKAGSGGWVPPLLCSISIKGQPACCT